VTLSKERKGGGGERLEPERVLNPCGRSDGEATRHMEKKGKRGSKG